MKAEKRKKLKDDSLLIKSLKTNTQPKYKFNISYDNLRCFINTSKSIKNNKRKPSFKSKPPIQKIHYHNYEPISFKIDRKIQQSHSPDLSRQASNQILKKIQSHGINCKWQDQAILEQTKQQEEEDKICWNSFSQSFSIKSYASTADMYVNVGKMQSLDNSNMDGYNYNFYSSSLIQSKMRGYSPCSFDIQINNIQNDSRTTIMIKNVPNKYSVQDLSAQIDAVLENSYDFLYLPCDLKNQCNVGYGFINLVDTSYLKEFYKQFHCKKWLKFRSQKICMLTYARLQGLESLIDHFQNSKVLNQKDKKYRPIIREMDKIQHLIKKQQEGKGMN